MKFYLINLLFIKIIKKSVCQSKPVGVCKEQSVVIYKKVLTFSKESYINILKTFFKLEAVSIATITMN